MKEKVGDGAKTMGEGIKEVTAGAGLNWDSEWGTVLRNKTSKIVSLFLLWKK